jgi:hypothetical protein
LEWSAAITPIEGRFAVVKIESTESPSSDAVPLTRAVIVSRVVHGLITVYMFGCIAIIWGAALQDRVGLWTKLALISLGIEGALVVAWRGRCPMNTISRRLGDDKPFFDLICGRYGKYGFPVLAPIIAVGVGLLGWRLL